MEEKRERPIRLLFLSITFQPEPGTMHGLPLAKWLRDNRGYEVEVLTAIPWYPLGRFYPGYRFRLFQREWMEGVPVARVPIYPSHDSSAARRILTYLSFMVSAAILGAPRVRRPDVVYYFDTLPTTGAVAWLIARLTGARTVQHVADMWPDTVLESGMVRGRTRALVGGILHRWCNFLFRRHAQVTAISPGFKRILAERGVVPASKLHVVYNWADDGQFFPAPRDEALAERLGMAGKVNLVYAGNIGPLQALETLLHAAARVRDLEDVQFVIVGTGPREEAIRALAAELDLPNVRIVGRLPLEEMNAVNALSDALLVHLRDAPFLNATIPGKTQVALASGRPLMMGVLGDGAELVRRAGAGVTFTPEDPDDLARAVREFVALPAEEREAMGRRGREFYEREITLDVAGARFDTLFREVARGGPALAPVAAPSTRRLP